MYPRYMAEYLAFVIVSRGVKAGLQQALHVSVGGLLAFDHDARVCSKNPSRRIALGLALAPAHLSHQLLCCCIGKPPVITNVPYRQSGSPTSSRTCTPGQSWVS